MRQRPTALDVFYGAERMGTVHDTSPLAFEYTQAWLDRQDAFPLSVIKLQGGMIDSPHVQAFFEKLLPEGELRIYLSEQRKASTLFSLLLEVAGDTAGAFVMLPHGQTPEAPAYEPTTWAALAKIVKNKSAAAIQIQGENTRISLAGAQDKASIAILDGKSPLLPKGSAPSTHILKPDIRRLAKVRESAANEVIIMRTAAPALLNAHKSSANTALVRPWTSKPSRSGFSSTSTWATTTVTPKTSRSMSVLARASVSPRSTTSCVPGSTRACPKSLRSILAAKCSPATWANVCRKTRHGGEVNHETCCHSNRCLSHNEVFLQPAKA